MASADRRWTRICSSPTAVLDKSLWTGVAGTIGIRIGDDDDPLAGVIRISAPGDRDVDVVVGRHQWPRELVDAARPVWHPSGEIPVVAPEGLVLLKLYAGGPQDLWDIQQLRAALGPSLDAAVVRALDRVPQALRDAWATLPRV